MSEKSAFENSELGNWNVAGGYVKIIFSHFADLNKFEKICMFGVEEFIDEFEIPKELIDVAKIKSLTRYAKTLENLIRDTKFAVRKNDKFVLDNLKMDILKIQNLIPAVSKNIIVDKKVIIKIDSEKYNYLFNLLLNIKENLLEPLNRADLIFVAKEEQEPVEIKKQLMGRLFSQG